ncbi:MAG: T9SS type A sorting domain-containing protein [Bacteroidetes bacterium]|nr:T9SS type A sorting domain-containing protein [Bacteroidota bacterium]
MLSFKFKPSKVIIPIQLLNSIASGVTASELLIAILVLACVSVFSLPSNSGAKQMDYTSGGTYILPPTYEVSQNQWSPIINLGNPTTDATNCPNVTYSNSSNVTALTADFSCGNGWASPHGKDAPSITQAISDDDCYYYGIHWPDSLCLYEKALTYFGVDPVMCRDSMRSYVEYHPFATVYPGETLDAFRYAFTSTADIWYAQTINTTEPWVNQYNWLVKMQPINSEAIYQHYVLNGLANALGHIDFNAEANMWYNITLLFPDDSGGNAACWKAIQGIRVTQSRIPEDTTPFYKLTFPLKPIPDAGVRVSAIAGQEMNVRVVTDADMRTLSVYYELASDGEADFMIYDQLGKALIHKRSSYVSKGDQHILLDINEIPSGAYFLRVQTAGSVVTKPFLITR